jgi:hypothetical protein
VLFSDIQTLTKLMGTLAIVTAAVNGQLSILESWDRHHAILIGEELDCDAQNTSRLLKTEICHFQEVFYRLSRKADGYSTLVRELTLKTGQPGAETSCYTAQLDCNDTREQSHNPLSHMRSS